jgi:SAM-dependent methyltransferase
MNDPYTDFKAKQREMWAGFAPFEVATTPPAGELVRFSGIQAGQKVLDVGCGTGVVAITARRRGAKVTGLDLTPELLAHAKENAAIAEFDDITWKEGDAENLPFRDGEFDAVLSQYGHMFAPRPEVAIREMLRVLRPSGTIAFSTWPPEHFTGKMFALTAKYLPPPPAGVTPVGEWGVPEIVQKRLGSAVRDVRFERGTMHFATLSPQHYRAGAERSAGPVTRIAKALAGEPAKLAQFRKEYDALVESYMDGNVVQMSFLMTRATKA